MRQTLRTAGIGAAILMIVAAIQVVTPAAAEAATTTETETVAMSHCGGSAFVSSDYGTNTVTSFWIVNPSLLNPPVCGQAAVALCEGGVFATGNFTTLPFVETSTATCPPGTNLVVGLTAVAHLP